MPNHRRRCADSANGLATYVLKGKLTRKKVTGSIEQFFRNGCQTFDLTFSILKNALAVWSDVRRGCAEMIVERKRVALSPDEWIALLGPVGFQVVSPPFCFC